MCDREEPLFLGPLTIALGAFAGTLCAWRQRSMGRSSALSPSP